MTVETELARALDQQAAAFSPTPTEIDEIARRARRRRRVRRATQGGAVVGVVALVGLLVATLGAPPPEPVVSDPSADARTRSDVSIFLCDERQCPAITEDERSALEDRLRSDPEVVAFVYESKEEAYERFRLQYVDQPDLVESVRTDDLPASFRVDLAPAADAVAFVERYGAMPGVEDVIVAPSLRRSDGTTDVPAWEVVLPDGVLAVGAGTCPLFSEAGGRELNSHLVPAELVVYEDGRVYVAAGAFAPTRSELGPSVVAQLTTVQLRGFIDRVGALDLGALPHLIEPSDVGVDDAGETVFQVRHGGRGLEIRAYALGSGTFPSDVLALDTTFRDVAAIARETGTPVDVPPDDVPLVSDGDSCGG